jgi:hypothetical protein
MFNRIKIKFEKCNGGWKNNKIDTRDYIVRPKPQTLAIRADLQYLLPDKENWFYQGSLGSCVVHGIANQIYALKNSSISRLYLYYYARYLERNKPPTSEGAYPRLAYKALTKAGCPDETYWPYSKRKANKKPKNIARRFAIDRSSLVYSWIFLDRSSRIRQCLNDKRLVTMGTQITQKMVDYRTGSDKILKCPGKNEKFLGGHYMCIFGYEKNHFLVANSWHGREVFLLDESWIEWNQSNDFCVLE